MSKLRRDDGRRPSASYEAWLNELRAEIIDLVRWRESFADRMRETGMAGMGLGEGGAHLLPRRHRDGSRSWFSLCRFTLSYVSWSHSSAPRRWYLDRDAEHVDLIERLVGRYRRLRVDACIEWPQLVREAVAQIEAEQDELTFGDADPVDGLRGRATL